MSKQLLFQLPPSKGACHLCNIGISKDRKKHYCPCKSICSSFPQLFCRLGGLNFNKEKKMYKKKLIYYFWRFVWKCSSFSYILFILCSYHLKSAKNLGPYISGCMTSEKLVIVTRGFAELFQHFRLQKEFTLVRERLSQQGGRVFYSFKWLLPAFAALIERGGGSQHPVCRSDTSNRLTLASPVIGLIINKFQEGASKKIYDKF